ncbi:hypothetical protein JVX90_00265 [Gordonia sp. PDNC005]|uniref:hypothetical protein n=1 Tax=Gordonia sp. PDNC005 TaxID=2811424 RepID=UPI0019646261|nr:hypothetical protein [Gordonia sp. PDNC005]QRY62746.1 hypothetical protein JVX90_00265 [Gordonia sp. PDNC005]
MTSIFSAITAAGVVYDRSDFADPKLSGPTALTVTADGRVYGHLAAWGTPHIGMGGRVTPPKSPSGYKYFHQGVVNTRDGDLPVGKLTLGTGHAPVDGRTDAVAAAAHYDNTGTVAAAVRAGEDEHGIWLAGRIVPGTAPERIDELRMSGVSGDWRGVNGQMELVAALAVNVPGFPLPRTEQLVAGGQPTALVAAGVVAPSAPPTADELTAMVSSAAEKIVDERLAAHRRRDAVTGRMTALVASANADRRQRAVDRMTRALTAAGGRRVRSMEGAQRFGVSIGDLIPEAMLQAQKTAGDFAEAAGNDVAKFLDPSRGKEHKKPDPSGGERAKAHTEDKASMSKDPDKGPAKIVNKAEPVSDEPKQDGAPKSDDKAKKPESKPAEKAAEKPKAKSAPNDSAKADIAPASNVDAKPDNTQAKGNIPEKPESSPAAEKERSEKKAEAVTPQTVAPAPDSAGAGTAPDAGAAASYFPADYPPAESSYADQEVGSPIDTTAPARLADNGEKGGPMEEDELPAVGANGGALVDYADGMAIYTDGSVTDGTEWSAADSSMIENAAAARAMDMQARAAEDPTTIQTDVPPRTSGYGVYMEEDQSSLTGANGGALTEYNDGVASYDDGTSTNGVVWSQTAAPEADPILAPPPTADQTLTASAYRRAMRRIGLAATPTSWRAAPKA